MIEAVSKREEGSALVAVLVMIAVLSTLVGAVLSFYVARHRFVVRDVQRTQAVYAAEAGVHWTLSRLSTDPGWRPRQELINISGLEAAVTARALGGYLQVRSSSDVGNGSATVQALVGGQPAEQYASALVLGDPTATFSFAGNIEVQGDILTGPRGIRYQVLNGRPFRGEVRGEIIRADSVQMPAFHDALFQETLRRADDYLGLLPSRLSPVPTVWPEASSTEISSEYVFVDSLAVLVAADGATLAVADSSLTSSPILLLAEGDLTIEGDLELAHGSQIIAGGRIEITGQLTGRDLLVIGDRITVSGSADLQGQLLARRGMVLDGGAFLSYPSIAYVAGLAGQTSEDGLRIERAVIEGNVLYVAGEGPPPGALATEPVRVYIGDNALVRGSVYCARRAELHGMIEGTLFAFQTYFYQSPSSYVNWLADGEISRPGRPDPFIVPIGIGPEARYEVLSQSESFAKSEELE